MYKKAEVSQREFEDFYLPFGGKLSSDNRWVTLARMIPWDEAEVLYRDHFSKGMGAPAKTLRIALGSLLIKERCGFTDRETVMQIKENPYLQYFLGFGEYCYDEPFDASTMVHFRKRLSLKFLAEVNEMIINAGSDLSGKDNKDDDNGHMPPKNRGKLIVDATCTPADIRFPTDISLLNEAREKLETMIDKMHIPDVGKSKKPRTYRKKARKDFLKAIKSKMKAFGAVRKAVGKQLHYVRRNLEHIKDYVNNDRLKMLSRVEYRNLLVIFELYRQQEFMFQNRVHRVDGRIVSITQPHVRAIVRGKAGKPVEFGAKLSISLIEGFTRIENFSWENFHEGVLLSEHIDAYKQRNGFYPESVHVDHIYRNRKNRKLCQELNIRISGPKLGRPSQDVQENKVKRKQREQDMRDRVVVEGKIGESKRRYTLNRVMAKLSDTSEAVIGVAIIALNLGERLRIFCAKRFWLQSLINIETTSLEMLPATG